MPALLCLVGLLAGSAPAGPKQTVDSARLIEDIRYLSSSELGGRGTGTPALDKAAAYLASKFADAGVLPLNRGSYLQPFNITLDATLGTGNRVAFSLKGERTDLSTADFLPFSFSAVGAVSGPLVFAGYGITAPECGYDDYAGLDVKGKIVVVLKHEPQEYDGDSRFEGRVYSEHSQLPSKALNARAHGASAILLVGDTANHTGTDTFDAFTALPAPGDSGIPYVQVKAEVVERWFTAAGREFLPVQQRIDRETAPQSFAFPDHLRVDLAVDIQRTSRQVQNVVAYVPGRTSEYVIVGAHYDHLGNGEQYSLAPDQSGTVHPGADDNASGTAGLLALARVFGNGQKPQRGILFLAFAGEELGLLGSTHYINNPVLPLANAVAMINMDMIGRMRNKKVVVGGAASGKGLVPVLQQAAKRHQIEIDTSERAVYGSSDHTAFKARMVPVLFFFTGLHQDYHRPTDTWEKIEGTHTAELLGLVAEVTAQLCRQGGRPQFVAHPGKPSQNVAERRSGGRSRIDRIGLEKSAHSPTVMDR